MTLLLAVMAALCLPAPFLRAADEKAEPELPKLPFIEIDRKNKMIDIEGKIVLREAEWLELLACMPKTREHESIMVLHAKPQHIHAALLMIGLKPGSPFRAERVNEEWKYYAPTGPAVAISMVYEADGKMIEVKASEWIVDQKNRKPMPDNHWTFTGSIFDQQPGKPPFYRADLEGNLLSLVNFGDEVLARKTEKRGGQEGGGGNETWTANTKAIPAVGTKVMLRMRPVKEEKKEEKRNDE